MSDCLKIEVLRQLVSGELSENQFSGVEAHLANCRACYQQWEALNSEITANLKVMATVKAPTNLITEYHHSLSKQFAPRSFLSRMQSWYFSIKMPSIYRYRLAGFAAALILFVTTALLVTYRVSVVDEMPAAAALPQSISFQEIESVSAFLLESEMLLLQLVNTSNDELELSENNEFIRSVANNLAGRAHLIQTKAIQWNDLSLLRLVSSLDVLFVEVANAENDEFAQRSSFVKEIVNEMDLLTQIRLAIGAAKQQQISPLTI